MQNEKKEFLQVGDHMQEKITNVGVLVSAVIAADIAIRPSLPKEFDQFNVSKQYWQNQYCYIMEGR